MRKKNLLFIFLFAMLCFACNKEDKQNYGASISPIEHAVNTSSSIEYTNRGNWTIATKFVSNKDGRITHLGARIGKGTYVVALWDSITQSVITSTSIIVNDSTIFTYKDIPDIDIKANTKYLISINTKRQDVNATGYYAICTYNIFPVTQGNITILSRYERQTTSALLLFPADNAEIEYDFVGIASFKFEPKQ
ncbi:MAG: DUF4082 domain-containing protein [Sphingobacteriales bacterium]|nr:MAG: DUF4082 domain-containing protein [Sphingobacteriales bacterium]